MDASHSKTGGPLETIAISPREGPIGADVSGLDLSQPLSSVQVNVLAAALARHKVLFFRGQSITSEQQIALGRQFGELEVHPFIAEGAASVIGADLERPELVVVESLAGKVSVAEGWHSDTTWRERPSMASILRMTIAPQSGGDTSWVDMAAAYQGLDDVTKQLIDDAVAIHDWHGFARGMRASGVAEDRIAALQARFPPVEHPVVRTHPVTGERLIYVNSAFTVAIKGMTADESQRVLNHLYAQATIPEHRVTLRWEQGTIAFWDNRSTQHSVAGDVVGHRRLERVTIVGDRPF
jgi:taurine dioxygenase